MAAGLEVRLCGNHVYHNVRGEFHLPLQDGSHVTQEVPVLDLGCDAALPRASLLASCSGLKTAVVCA